MTDKEISPEFRQDGEQGRVFTEPLSEVNELTLQSIQPSDSLLKKRRLNLVKFDPSEIHFQFKTIEDSIKIWDVKYSGVCESIFDLNPGIFGEIRMKKSGKWMFLDGLVTDIGKHNTLRIEEFHTPKQFLPFVSGYQEPWCIIDTLNKDINSGETNLDTEIMEKILNYYRSILDFSLKQQDKVTFNKLDKQHRVFSKIDNLIHIFNGMDKVIHFIEPAEVSLGKNRISFPAQDVDYIDVINFLLSKKLINIEVNSSVSRSNLFSYAHSYGFSQTEDYNRQKKREEELLSASKKTVDAQVDTLKNTEVMKKIALITMVIAIFTASLTLPMNISRIFSLFSSNVEDAEQMNQQNTEIKNLLTAINCNHCSDISIWKCTTKMVVNTCFSEKLGFSSNNHIENAN